MGLLAWAKKVILHAWKYLTESVDLACFGKQADPKMNQTDFSMGPIEILGDLP